MGRVVRLMLRGSGHFQRRPKFYILHFTFKKRSFVASLLRMTEGEATRTPACVTLSSSSHAYAVSILPNGKMLALQGGSSSSQKSRFAAIFGSPVIIARRVEKSCAVRIGKQTPSLFMPSPFVRGKVARAAFAARDG